MRLNRIRSTFSILVAILALISFPSFASVGTVLHAFGQVTVETPTVSSLGRGATLNEGDVIVTGPKAYVQLKLADGTKLAIRAGSRFTIEALEAPATATTPAIGAGRTLKASFNLQRGGFRTITGKIAKRDPSAYKLTTPIAVIRVRGTDYSASLCSGNCAANDDGLYVGVSVGGVTIENDGGSLDLGKNQFAFTANVNTPPQLLIAPPDVLTDDGLDAIAEDEEDESDDSESGESESGAEESGESEGETESGATSSEGGETTSSTTAGVGEREGAPPPPPPPSTTALGTQTTSGNIDVPPEIPVISDTGEDLTGGETVFVPRGLAFSHGGQSAGFNTNDETTQFETTAEDKLISFDRTIGAGETATFSIGNGVNRNVGSDAFSGLKWGRWSAGAVANTGADDVNLTNQSLHWVVNSTEVVPDQVITGSATYLLVGNTDPTDNLGNVGFLGSASFSADFTNSTVDSSLQLGINNQVWTASGNGSITKNLFSGQYNSVTVGSGSGTGAFNGIFGGFNGGEVPKGAGLTYQLNSGSTTVSGSAVFNNAGGQ